MPSEDLRNLRPTAIDLFCGAGGLALGLEQAGFDVLASVDYDPVHAAVHSFNFPLCETSCGDLSAMSADQLHVHAARGWANYNGPAPWDGEVDVIVGGPPCQGFSTIGKRLIDDPRNQLVFHFFRLICELRPRYFIMENVPGMGSGGHSSILHSLIEEFETNGYSITSPPRALNAADHGVPQDRTRLFILGARMDQPQLRYPEQSANAIPKRASTRTPAQADGLLPFGPSVKEAIGDLPDLDGFPDLLESDEVPLDAIVLQCLEDRASKYVRQLRGLDVDALDASYPRAWNPRLLTSSHRTLHTGESVRRFTDTAVGETEPISRFYRLDPEGLSNTLRAGTGTERGAYTSPRPIHPYLPRVISVREAARLHSFPDWFRLHRTKWHGFRQIGNAVPPFLGRAVGRTVVLALGIIPVKPTRMIELGDASLLSLTMSEAAELFGAARDDIPKPRQRSLAL